MPGRTTRLAAVLAVLLSVSGVAGADGGRARTLGQLEAAPKRYQAAARPEVATANTATTRQQGRGNAAGIAQTGSGNTAGLVQFGRENTGAITQAGTGNSACLIQSGRNLDGAITQVGDNLTAGVLQTPWGAREIPVEACDTVTRRQDIREYVLERPGNSLGVRGRGRGRNE